MEKLSYESCYFKIYKLDAGVYVAISSSSKAAKCNVGIVDLGGNVVVFDTFFSEDAANDLLKFIKDEIGKSDIIVVNSHHHNDHFGGNIRFLEETQNLIMTKETEIRFRTELHSNNPTKVTGDIKIVNIIDEVILTGNNRSVKLKVVCDTHTKSDVVMYLDNERIVFMGDLLFTNRHPNILNSNIQNWFKYLNFLMVSEYCTYISGHGKIANKMGLKELMDYFKYLTVASKPNNQKKRTNEDSKYASWAYQENFITNLQVVLNSDFTLD